MFVLQNKLVAKEYFITQVSFSLKIVFISYELYNILFYLGYWIWSFQGKILKRVNLDNFAQLLWRPRPPTLLSAEQHKEIKKNLKKYYAQFESKDRMRMTKASKELIEKRATLMKNFEEYRKTRVQKWNDDKPRRLELRNRKFFYIEQNYANHILFAKFPSSPVVVNLYLGVEHYSV